MEKIKKVQLNLDNISMGNVREYLGSSFNGFFSLPESKICTLIDTLNGVVTAYDTDFISKDKENNFIIINKTT